jgi:hypothetical protein
VVVFLHGRHATCYAGQAASLEWPCSPLTAPIPSYQGYDYISETIASWGYIVVSISANGINAYDNAVADLGMSARAQLVQKHLDLWKAYDTTGGEPFGGKFVGKVDLGRVGTMGHSRGGEGVVTHYAYNQSLGSPYTVRAVFPLAPVDFARPVVNTVPMATMLPYCDGDVSDLEGVHYYDDARYNVPGDPAAKNTILVMGADHNFFNTVWTPGLFPAGTADDWTFVPRGAADPHCSLAVPGNGRLTSEQQRAVGLAYIAAFFRMTLGLEDFASLFSGDMSRPASIGAAAVWVSYHAPEATRRDVNRLLSAADLVTNTLGGAVTQTGMVPYKVCGGAPPEPSECDVRLSDAQQPHTTQSANASDMPGLSQMKAGWWRATAAIANDVPAGAADVSDFTALVFRAGVNWGDPRTSPTRPLDVTVTLTDGTGASGSAVVGAHSGALFYPPGAVDPVPKLFLNTVRLPLSAFLVVDLGDVRQVTFRFDQGGGGALVISDIAFAR